MTDIHFRRVWSLSTGRMLDDCEIDNVDDATLPGRSISLTTSALRRQAKVS